MASKHHIKETINALCQVILQSGGTKITPETFRLAKFDKNEATGAMWTLLFETTWCVNFRTFKTEKLNLEKIFWTKYELFKRGYYVKNFYLLPEDSSFGSREVLLAFGWIVSKVQLLRQLLENCTSFFEECLPIDWESQIPMPSYPDRHKTNSQQVSASNEITNIEQFIWVLGKLRLTCKGLFTAENKLASFVSKLHSSTLGASSPKGHLSALEVYLLRHPTELDNFIEKTEQYNMYLECLMQFVEMENVFWKWMESVCDAKIRDDSVWQAKEPCELCLKISDKMLQGVHNSQTEIEKIINDIKKQCPNSSELEAMSNDCKSVGNMKIQELNQELEELTLSKRSPTEIQTFPELRQVAGSNVKDSRKTSAQQEIESLKTKLSELELKILDLENRHFDVLNNLVTNLKDVVFIPPIGKTKYLELKNK